MHGSNSGFEPLILLVWPDDRVLSCSWGKRLTTFTTCFVWLLLFYMFGWWIVFRWGDTRILIYPSASVLYVLWVMLDVTRHRVSLHLWTQSLDYIIRISRSNWHGTGWIILNPYYYYYTYLGHTVPGVLDSDLIIICYCIEILLYFGFISMLTYFINCIMACKWKFVKMLY